MTQSKSAARGFQKSSGMICDSFVPISIAQVNTSTSGTVKEEHTKEHTHNTILNVNYGSLTPINTLNTFILVPIHLLTSQK